jgi:hypothetical protein
MSFYLLSLPPVAQQPLVGQGFLIIEPSRTHSDTPHSVGPLWASDQPDTETSTWVCGWSLAGIAGANPAGGMLISTASLWDKLERFKHESCVTSALKSAVVFDV